ncbi:TPA: ogr/Delta-like zinc finger family protein [Escherichia coli]|uniref:Transcriptional regulator n=1 Tax=Escherichia coli TaxID=562 RepID=A0A6L6ZTZ5_ECOLX|nr:ogr/Delta-like zinc finger family protein [Escherichia coli]DAN94617.1 MAG TPA: Ogr/Delta-like zinc finger protein [Caudoviricetes sp.]EFC5375553.1 ogr/Delta-like zinc finger family protein [Escherichia coli]EGO4138652.1 ogr/Delta-like zinc finger family protein [Escherichia coli]EGO4196938.1 ogr/Delta-like zinc finger family protein [Escherichia coli]EHL6436740.1 ogr/Delta-like zinc finger family protein [Escherichia coli]
MHPCPYCGASTRTRTSRNANDTGTIREKYYQCNNIECSATFVTHEFVVRTVCRPQPTEERGIIPADAFKACHRGRDQLSLPLGDCASQSKTVHYARVPFG